MDLDWFNLLILIFCVSLGFVYLFYKLSSSSTAKLNLPPGRKGFPFIGETLDYIRAIKSTNPERFVVQRTIKHSPDVFRTSLLGEDMAVFCGTSGNKFLYSNKNLLKLWWPRTLAKLFFPASADKPIVSPRKHLMQYLKPESLQHYIPVMDSMAKEHIQKDWSPYKEVKVSPLSKKYTLALACRLFVNVEDPKSVAEFAHPYNIAVAGLISVPINLPGTTFNRALKASKIITKKIRAFIGKRKLEIEEAQNSGKMDLMTSLILDGMTDDEIVDRILGFFVASYETTSSVITHTISYLADYPLVYRRVFEEQMDILKCKGEGELLNWEDLQKMKYTWCVACEVMRLVPPALGGFREAITDFTYAGYTIPKGWKTFWTTHSTHKNPKYFPEPEKFDPSRFEGDGPAPFAFVPFGGGSQMCPGKEYARLEMLVFIHNVITKFKWEKLIPNEKVEYMGAPFPVKGLPISLKTVEVGN